ncbi:MAG TPA: hypothetical protein ENG21_03520, partial [Nitrososphaeria archaeon]|nr:hypothetical protein [Nitrososphaeria archaeon]
MYLGPFVLIPTAPPIFAANANATINSVLWNGVPSSDWHETISPPLVLSRNSLSFSRQPIYEKHFILALNIEIFRGGLNLSFVGGVDVGATSTKSIIIDFKGRLLGRGIGPGVNPFTMGYEAAAEIMVKTLSEAMRGVCEFKDLACVVFGSTGLETIKSRELVKSLIEKKSGISKVFVVTDSRIAL